VENWFQVLSMELANDATQYVWSSFCGHTKIRKVLINAVGFGGNAVSVLLSL
jgi:3-oxoacyl-(acyl-carrier-protein) synthase